MTALRSRVRDDAIDAAARAAWEHDHPRDPWDTAPASVQRSMRGLVRPTVDAVLEHLDARALLDLEPEPDTFPDGKPFDVVITYAFDAAQTHWTTVRYVHKGVPVVATVTDTWQDVATRYSAALEADTRS